MHARPLPGSRLLCDGGVFGGWFKIKKGGEEVVGVGCACRKNGIQKSRYQTRRRPTGTSELRCYILLFPVGRSNCCCKPQLQALPPPLLSCMCAYTNDNSGRRMVAEKEGRDRTGHTAKTDVGTGHVRSFMSWTTSRQPLNSGKINVRSLGSPMRSGQLASCWFCTVVQGTSIGPGSPKTPLHMNQVSISIRGGRRISALPSL